MDRKPLELTLLIFFCTLTITYCSPILKQKLWSINSLKICIEILFFIKYPFRNFGIFWILFSKKVSISFYLFSRKHWLKTKWWGVIEATALFHSFKKLYTFLLYYDSPFMFLQHNFFLYNHCIYLQHFFM